MKTSTTAVKTERLVILLSVLFILFWLFAAGSKLYDFNTFKGEMNSQVFSAAISKALAYTLPIVEITIASLLIYSSTRLIGMALTFSIMLIFSMYVGLAVLNVYSQMPCNCAGLLGQNSTWPANFILNLFITVVAAIGLIITFKEKERRKKGMRDVLSHAPLPA